MFRDRLERDSTSPTFHHDNFCCFVFSPANLGLGELQACLWRGVKGRAHEEEEEDELLPPSLSS